MRQSNKPSVRVVRVAIYTRKSTSDGLEMEFNSLHAQRESAEAFVRSQAGEGWVALPKHYDDGGYSGGSTDRPALQQLLADVRAGEVDCVVVYKLDRLSRSLLDFATLMQLFEEHAVTLVSTTQMINTHSATGKLLLNILLSFAEFERELISERTRDKMSATRRKGKFAGGTPPLGYDLHRDPSRLVVNEDEAVIIRTIFTLYLQHEAMLPVVEELARRNWRNKRWPGPRGEKGGGPFTRTSLHRLLTNPVYIGMVRHRNELFEGEHEAIVDAGVWQRAQAILRRNARTGGAQVRDTYGAFLKGLLACSCCQSAMSPSVTVKKDRRYHYYRCTAGMQKGKQACPTRSIPASPIEDFVLEQIRTLGSDQTLVEETLRQMRQQEQGNIHELEAERRGLERDLARWHDDLLRMPRVEGDDYTLRRLADLQDQIRLAERQRARVREQLAALRQQQIDEDEARATMAAFTPLWEALTPREKSRLVELVVQKVEFNGEKGTIKVTFHPEAVRSLSQQINQMQEQRA